jgi:hypothetical protein
MGVAAMTTLVVPAAPKLPVWQTVAACYATVGRNLGQLVRISWLWLLILLPVYAALHWLDWAWQQERGLTSTIAASGLLIMIELPALASIAVAWHRLILRQERVTARAYLRLGGNVWLYVLYTLLLGLLFLAPLVLLLLPIADDPDSVWMPAVNDSAWLFWLLTAFVLAQAVALFLALAVGFLVLPRLSLVLPAVALGEPLSLRRAWRMTRANTLRLTLASVLCILPGFLPSLPAFWWAWTGAAENGALYVMGELISSVGYAVFAIFAVTLLSLTYRFFAEGRGEDLLPSA